MRALASFFCEALLVMASGCGQAEAPVSPQIVGTSFTGVRSSPTATLDVELTRPIDAASAQAAVLLVRGEPSHALERPLPPARELARLVAIRIESDGAHLRVTPRRALEVDSRYTLLLGAKLVAGGARLGRAWPLAVDTGELDDAAPILELTAPLDGAVDVPRNLREVRVGFSRPVSMPAAVALVGEDGAEVSASAVARDDGTHLVLGELLRAGAYYSLRAAASVTASDGQPLFGDPPGFMAGDVIRTGPIVLQGFDVETSDRCVVARFRTEDAAVTEVCASGLCAVDGPQRDHEAALWFGSQLNGGSLALRARAWDETRRPRSQTQAQVPAPPAVALELTEVLTRPRGPRSAQQFVELHNAGQTPIALDGWSLHTGSGANALPAQALDPGSYAVVVPRGYVAGAGGDPAPAVGALVLRVDEAHLGGRALRVSGEPAWIEDSSGQVVTRWSGFAASTAVGQSIERIGPCDVAANFQPTASGGSTPGGP